MKRDLTLEDVKAICSALEVMYDFRVYEKSRSDGMRVIGSLLETMHIVDKKSFMEDYCTTILDTVYLNFTPGEAADGWPPVVQLVTIVHEATHVVQYRKQPGFVTAYLLTAWQRARFEAEAYAAGSTIQFWLGGGTIEVDFVANALTHYGCNVADIALARQVMTTSNSTIERGAMVGEVAQYAISKLKERGVL